MNSNLHWTVVAFLPLMAGVILMLLMPLVWAHRKRSTGIAFLGSVIACGIWAFGYVLELSATNQQTALFWANIEYFGIPTAAATTLAFILLMSSEFQNRSRLWLLLTTVPAGIWCFVWSDDTHHLLRRNVHFDFHSKYNYSTLSFTGGPLFYFNTVFCYSCIAGAIFVLVGLTKGRNYLTGRQAKTILAGLTLPIIGNFLGLVGIQPIAGVDLTPMLFALSAVMSADGVFRWSLLTVAPIARDKVVDDLADGIVVLDPDRKVIDANPAASRILGIDPNHMSRSTPRDWVLPVDTESMESESFFNVADKSYLVRRSFLTGAGSANVGTILQLVDVTEQTRIQEELRRAKEAAEEASAVKSRFVANISHELRTPLNGVIGLADLLNGTSLDTTQKDYLNGIMQCSNTLLGLISDVLDFSKLDANAMPIADASLDIGELVNELAAVHRYLTASRGLQFSSEVADLPKYIRGDSLRLRQIIHNLVSNATKFTERGSVSVRARGLDDGFYEIVVADTGIGIPEHMHAAVFEAFQQADATTSRRFGGTGLGLPITRALIERMGGSISLESVPSQGTTIRVLLPLTPGEAPPTQETSEEIPTGLRVLVAEDNEVNTLVITAMLERMECVYQHCENGLQAVEAFADNEFDLILLDIQMPVLDGLQACQAIRKQWPERPTLIYALTANAFEEERERAEAAGMNGFLTKPLKSTELATALRTAARSTANLQAAVSGSVDGVASPSWR